MDRENYSVGLLIADEIQCKTMKKGGDPSNGIAPPITEQNPGVIPTVNKLNRMPDKLRLEWVGGQRGKPSLNADILNAAEATRMIADPWWEVLGTNMTSALSTYNAEGGITLTTAGADADQAYMCPHLDANQSPFTEVTWGSDQQTRFEANIKIGADIGHAVIWAGLKLTYDPTVATDDDQVFFRYENGVNSAAWQCINSIGGTDDTDNTTSTVVVSTAYKLMIDIDSSRIARFYIDDVLVATSAALTTAKDFIPYIGVLADGEAAAKAITVRAVAMERAFA